MQRNIKIKKVALKFRPIKKRKIYFAKRPMPKRTGGDMAASMNATTLGGGGSMGGGAGGGTGGGTA